MSTETSASSGPLKDHLQTFRKGGLRELDLGVVCAPAKHDQHSPVSGQVTKGFFFTLPLKNKATCFKRSLRISSSALPGWRDGLVLGEMVRVKRTPRQIRSLTYELIANQKSALTPSFFEHTRTAFIDHLSSVLAFPRCAVGTPRFSRSPPTAASYGVARPLPP